MSSLSAFLSSVEPLRHHDRTKQVIELGARAHRGDADARALLAALEASTDAFARLLAITACHGSRDGEALVRGANDVSRRVRWSAALLAALIATDAQVETILGRIVERKLLVRMLARLLDKRRQHLVDRFVTAGLASAESGGAGGNKLALDCLAYTSSAVVALHVDILAEQGSTVGWCRLARHHAGAAVACLQREIERTDQVDYRVRHRWLTAAPQLAERCPDATLTLAEALLVRGESLAYAHKTLRILVRQRPAATFDLVRRVESGALPTRVRGSFGGVRFDKVVHHLGQERLHILLTHGFHGLSDGRRGRAWFFRLSANDRAFALRTFRDEGRAGFGGFLFHYLSIATPEDRDKRAKAFERFCLANHDKQGVISIATLSPLPDDLRHMEARRHLDNVKALASDPDRRLPYAALLPFPEALNVLAPQLGHPEGEERAKALRILFSSLRLDADEASTTAALAAAKARKFEQDPVRRAICETLADLPIVRFGAAHLEAAGAIVSDALDAADLSSATAAAVERWVCRLFRVDGDWASEQLARLFRVRGSVSTWGLGEGLTKAEVTRLAPAIERLVAGWATKERANTIVGLGYSLQKRLRHAPPVLDALERLTRELPFVHVAASALGLLRKEARPRFVRLCDELLTTDPSFVLLPDVARYVGLSRQDRLAPLLTGAPMTGRFATGRTHWVIDFGPGTGRWTSDQQKTYASQLVNLLSDQDRDVPTLRFAIERLSRLSFADASAILPFASDPRPPVRELALRSLPWLDARQGVPVLIEALGDERARYAIYALRKVFAELSPEAVLTTLRSVSMKKVTVAKEVIRLLGELGSSEAREDLFRLAASVPPLHRDVRIALLRALWDHLDDPRSWDLLVSAVNDADWVVASRVAELPLDRLSPAQDALLAPLFAGVLRRPEPEARLDLLQRARGLLLRDQQRAFFHALLDHLATGDDREASLALCAATDRMRNGTAEADQIIARFGALFPRRHRLAALATSLGEQLGPYSRAPVVRIAAGLVNLLVEDLPLAPTGLRLGAKLWKADGFVSALVALSNRNWLGYDTMQAAIEPLTGRGGASEIDRLLQPMEDPRLRRIGLAALVSAASWHQGWTRAYRDRLALYRADEAPIVAAAAVMVQVPGQDT